MARRTGGGAATTSGVNFQVAIGAYYAVQILAEKAAEPPFGYSAACSLIDVFAETVQPVDDLRVGVACDGDIFIQAKTTIDCSASALATVARQFIEQYRKGWTRPGAARRDLQPEKDRLLLAVGHQTPSTVSILLREALDRVRRATEHADLKEIRQSMSAQHRQALDALVTSLRSGWLHTTTEELSSNVLLNLLHLIHVRGFDFRIDGAELREAMNLLRQSVLEKPDQAGQAWARLLEIVSSFCPSKTGGRRSYFRDQLESVDVPIQVPRGFADDIRQLKSYTTRTIARLQDLAQIRYGTSPIKLERPIVSELSSFAKSGHTLVTGEPGAGKSGCIHDLAAAFEQSVDFEVVLIAVDRIRCDTEQVLAQELGLTTGGLCRKCYTPGRTPGMLS